MNDDAPALVGQPAEVFLTLQITRAATGKTETVNVVGHIQPAQQEDSNGDNSQPRSA